MSEYQRTALSNRDLTLFAKNNEDSWASLSFELIANGRKKDDNVLQITVWTNEKSDTDRNISITLDVMTLGIFIQNLKEAAAAPAGTKFEAPIIGYEATRWKKEGGKNIPDGNYLQSRLFVGKDESGCVWMSVISAKPSRPAIKFVLHQNKFRKLVDRRGEPISLGRQTELVAQSYARLLEQMAYSLLVANFVPPEPQGQSSSGGNNYQQNNNRNNYQQSQGNSQGGGGQSQGQQYVHDIDDDIPF